MKIKTDKSHLTKALFEVFRAGYAAALDDIKTVMDEAPAFDESDYYTIIQSFSDLMESNDIDEVIEGMKREGIL